MTKRAKMEAISMPSDPEQVGEFYGRVLGMLEAGLIEVLIRPTTPGRRGKAVKTRDAEADLRTFLRERVAEAPKRSVTTVELTAAYEDWRKVRGLPAVGRRGVESALAEAMLEEFGASKRNDVPRNGTARKGWTGVCLVAVPES